MKKISGAKFKTQQLDVMETQKSKKGKERDVSSAGGSNRPQGGVRKEKKSSSSGDRLKAKEEEYR